MNYVQNDIGMILMERFSEEDPQIIGLVDLTEIERWLLFLVN